MDHLKEVRVDPADSPRGAADRAALWKEHDVLGGRCGDVFRAHYSGGNKPGEIADAAAMERYMAETKGETKGGGAKSEGGLVYGGKEALILEWVRPSRAGDESPRATL